MKTLAWIGALLLLASVLGYLVGAEGLAFTVRLVLDLVLAAAIITVAYLTRIMRAHRESIAMLEQVVGELIQNPQLACEHGLLRTIHCEACVEAGEAIESERGDRDAR